MMTKTRSEQRAELETYLRHRSNNASVTLRSGEAKIVLDIMDDLEAAKKALAATIACLKAKEATS